MSYSVIDGLVCDLFLASFHFYWYLTLLSNSMDSPWIVVILLIIIIVIKIVKKTMDLYEALINNTLIS